MSSNRLIYDNCETNERDGRNRNMLDWTMDVKKHEHEKRCRHKIGLVSGVEVQEVQRNLVDLESELRGQYHVYSRCPEDKHSYANNGISAGYVNVEQHYCKGARKIKTQFPEIKDCQMLDFRNVGMDSCSK
jgi:hypothetical protein